jgi:hypothetical protein
MPIIYILPCGLVRAAAIGSLVSVQDSILGIAMYLGCNFSCDDVLAAREDGRESAYNICIGTIRTSELVHE